MYAGISFRTGFPAAKRRRGVEAAAMSLIKAASRRTASQFVGVSELEAGLEAWMKHTGSDLAIPILFFCFRFASCVKLSYLAYVISMCILYRQSSEPFLTTCASCIEHKSNHSLLHVYRIPCVLTLSSRLQINFGILNQGLFLFCCCQGSRDLMAFVAPFERANVGWKTYPNLEVLGTESCAKLSHLLMGAGCGNGMLPIKKLEKAVLSCQRNGNCNLSRRSDAEMSWVVGLTIRIMFQKWRWLKDEPHEREACFAKAGSISVLHAKGVIDALTDEVCSDGAQQPAQVQQPAPEGGPLSLTYPGYEEHSSSRPHSGRCLTYPGYEPRRPSSRSLRSEDEESPSPARPRVKRERVRSECRSPRRSSRRGRPRESTSSSRSPAPRRRRVVSPEVAALPPQEPFHPGFAGFGAPSGGLYSRSAVASAVVASATVRGKQ